MKLVTKRLLWFLAGTLVTLFYCEFLLYYVVIAQCSWPEIYSSNELRAFILADIHMLGPWRGHWLDKWRREWQMHRSFQTILTVHKPEVVFILGDIFDEGEWTDQNQFNDYVERFNRLFSVPDDIKLYVVVGNHDIGFHNNIRRIVIERFTKSLNSPSVQHLVLKDNHFVLLNSMALHGDSCYLCSEARRDIRNVSDTMNCYKDKHKCTNSMKQRKYSRPIILQHFPLYRESDSICTEPDAPPLPLRNKKFRNKIDALSKEATDYLVTKLKPRYAFGGHTHHGCFLKYSVGGVDLEEHSVPSFSWRNRPDPKYMLVSFTPETYQVNKCGLPMESTIILSAVIFTCLNVYLLFSKRFLKR